MTERCETLLHELRSLSPEAYIACLYLNEDVRCDATALYLFDAEISRIPSLVSEPMPGEIRLQFWRDLIAGGTESGAGPLWEALSSTINKHDLPREVFHNYLNARIFDLYNDPMPDMGTLEGYLGETHSVFFQMVALCLGESRSTKLADACGHAGMALGLSRLLASLSHHTGQQRIYIPLTVLEASGLTAQDWLGSTPGEAHLSVVSEMIALANDHLEKALTSLKKLPDSVRPAFLPLAFVAPTLKTVERAGVSIFKRPASLGPVRRQWVAFTWAFKH